MVESEGYVYFAVKTEDISIEENTIDNFLGLKANDFNKMKSKGRTPVCSVWEISTKRTNNPDISYLIDQIISIILPYKEKLKELKKRYTDIEYVFEIVIFHGDNAIGFSIPNELLSFLGEVGAFIDVDQYNCKD
jgi:hypothetical protein